MSSIRLIAMREIRTRLRSKAYIISTIALVVVLVALTVMVKLFGGGGGNDDYTIGVTGPTTSHSAPLIASGHSIGETVRTVTVTDPATGRQQLRDGTLDALLTGDPTSIHATVKTDLDPTLGDILHILAGQTVFSQKITALGGDPAAVSAAVAAASVTVTPLEKPHNYDTQRLVLGIVAGILIYLSLLLNGQAVASGVVEEKSSRVVELLLAAVRPWQLMAGKVLGIGLVGLLQLAVVGGIGIASALATGALTISGGAAAGTVIWLIVWYLLGYLAYALAFAAAAATVSRQEDVNGVVAPLMILVIAGYSLGASILPTNPGSPLISTLSMIPTFSPTLMPMRLSMGGVPIWQSAVAVGGMIVVIPLLVGLSARIYRNAVLRTGARVKLSDAWRAA
jgi:ABC-2 type transport system permease protein